MDKAGSMQLTDIYHPIRAELKRVEGILAERLGKRGTGTMSDINEYLLNAKGKRLRPALAILSARAASEKSSPVLIKRLVKLATALELTHMASLVHDDVIDKSELRHDRPTVNAKWGDDVSVAVGDYLYSEAFNLISDCDNPDIIGCMSSAIKDMCEGELIQVCERDKLNMLKQGYVIIVKKKTASLFGAACHAGAILMCRDSELRNSLKEYGINFGIAFQMRDDCMDLIGQRSALGKTPGTDFMMGELTLPVLKLLSKEKNKGDIISLLKQTRNREAFKEIRERFISSGAINEAKKEIALYANRAKDSLSALDDSCFKESLAALADRMDVNVAEAGTPC